MWGRATRQILRFRRVRGNGLTAFLNFLNQQHSLRHEEPYFKRTFGHRPPNMMELEFRQRGFFAHHDFLDHQFWVHVAHYFVGKISYTPGEMRNDTHLIRGQLPGDTLQRTWCSQVLPPYPEDSANEAIDAGDISIYDSHAAHIRFSFYGWETFPYHLFLQNCQHWTEWVLYGTDTTGITIANLWGFGRAAFYLPGWVVAALWLIP